MPSYDWNEVVAMKPKGYVELNDGQKILHGPIDMITIDDSDMVGISMKWGALVPLNELGIPHGNWRAVFNTPSIGVFFPNLVVPYVIEDTPSKGRRIRFGFSIIYLDEIMGLDPSRVEGLILPS